MVGRGAGRSVAAPQGVWGLQGPPQNINGRLRRASRCRRRNYPLRRLSKRECCLQCCGCWKQQLDPKSLRRSAVCLRHFFPHWRRVLTSAPLRARTELTISEVGCLCESFTQSTQTGWAIDVSDGGTRLCSSRRRTRLRRVPRTQNATRGHCSSMVSIGRSGCETYGSMPVRRAGLPPAGE